MGRYHCGVCGLSVAFDASRCGACGAELGFVPERDEVVVVDPVRFQRCLNAAWGCNWILDASSGETWCASCRLTRGRPDTGRPDAISAWETAEKVKRCLVRHLMVLGLPIDRPCDPPGGDPDSHPGGEPDGVVFDLVFVPGNPGMTGHRPGTITLDLREVDDDYRNKMRESLGEAERTVLGHLRHEVGHHYWRVLVDAPRDHAAFRALFGDERTDYAEALAAHYEQPRGAAPPGHLTPYAAAHPSEDWAESFAHYLAIRDGLETVDAHAGGAGAATTLAVFDDRVVARWLAVTDTVNAVTVGLGHRAPYPYRITAPVAEKLAYVHRRVVATTNPP